MKYNKENGTVKIEAKEIDGGFLRLSVADTGIGIEENKHGDLFKMFNRVTNDPMTTVDGIGIGLAVSKMLADRLSGNIGLASELGRGSTFWIDIPTVSNCAALIWTDNLRVGVDAIDSDHQKIFSLVNRVSRYELSHDELAQIVTEMHAYTSYHFRREEAIMHICGHPDLTQHIKEHHKLEQHVAELAKAWHSNDNKLTLDQLRVFLRSWWIGHILHTDTTIAEYAKGKEDAIAKGLAELTTELLN